MRHSCFLLFLYTVVLFVQPVAGQKESELPFTPASFAVWSQRMDMSAYIGKPYRLKVAIRTLPADADGLATAFIRNEKPEGGLRAWVWMDNMMDRPVRDSVWKTYELNSIVEKKAPWIAFGVLSLSSGVYFFDDMHLEVAEKPGVWTELPIPNGDFEAEHLLPWQQTAQGVPIRVLGATATLSTERPFAGKQCLRVENQFFGK